MNWQRLSLAARRRGPCCKAGALGKKRRNSRGVPSSLCAACTPRLAEREGFEPPVPLSTTVFKTVAIDHSAISPGLVCECKIKKIFLFGQIQRDIFARRGLFLWCGAGI